jgi:Protein of unknown function (DUF2726)
MLRRITNASEHSTFRAIEAAIMGTEYRVFPKLPIHEVLDVASLPDLSKPLRNTLNTSHFDFVVVGPDHMPKYAVEFDGPHHFEYRNTRSSDIRKNKLCAIAGFPLLRVTDVELETLDDVSILEFMTHRMVAWEDRYPALRAEMDERISFLSADELRQLTENGCLDPSLDAFFWFDQEHPFPLAAALRSRLGRCHGLLEQPPASGSAIDTWFQVLPVCGGGAGCTHRERVSFGIYRGRPGRAPLRWHGGHLTAPGIDVLKEDSVAVGIRWPLIIEVDYDGEEAPIDYMLRTGRVPVCFPNLPGAHVPSICEAVAEYLALREVARWADAHPRR